MVHPNCMIGRTNTDPAAVRCESCRRIAVSCEADLAHAGERCCDDCTH